MGEYERKSLTTATTRKIIFGSLLRAFKCWFRRAARSVRTGSAKEMQISSRALSCGVPLGRNLRLARVQGPNKYFISG
jgi:hypothetical protein